MLQVSRAVSTRGFTRASAQGPWSSCVWKWSGVILGCVTVGAAISVSAPATAALVAATLIAALLWRHPPALYVLFLYIGVVKDEGIVAGLPVDVTFLLALLLTLRCGARWLLEGLTRARPPLWIVLVFALLSLALLASLGWTSAPEYGSEKAIRFATLTTLAGLAPFFILRTRSDLVGFAIALTVIAGLTAVLTLATGIRESTERFGLGEANKTIEAARILGAGVLALLFGFATVNLHRLWRVAAALGLVVIAFAIGSRGPLVALLLAVIVGFGIQMLATRRQAFVLAASVVALGMVALPLVPLPEASVSRFTRLTQNPRVVFQSDRRAPLYEAALELIQAHPVRGVGAGGFSAVTPGIGQPEQRYPHNLFLEIAAELGIMVALFTLIAVLVVARRVLLEAFQGDPALVFSGSFLVFNFLSAQFSSDLNGNRSFWAALGIAAAVGWQTQRASSVEVGKPPQPTGSRTRVARSEVRPVSRQA